MAAKSTFPRLSKATFGILFEIALAIVDRLGVKAPIVIWGLFILGLALISDAFIRSDWIKNEPVRRIRMFRRVFSAALIGIAFIIFGQWIYGRQNPEQVFCFGQITYQIIPGNPHLFLVVVGGKPVTDINITLMDLSNVKEGGDATSVLRNARHFFAPIAYPAPVANDTGLEIEPKGSLYNLMIGTAQGSFNEDLKITAEGQQRITLSTFPENKPLLTNWNPNRN